jgi:hypothetical protein
LSFEDDSSSPENTSSILFNQLKQKYSNITTLFNPPVVSGLNLILGYISAASELLNAQSRGIIPPSARERGVKRTSESPGPVSSNLSLSPGVSTITDISVHIPHNDRFSISPSAVSPAQSDVSNMLSTNINSMMKSYVPLDSPQIVVNSLLNLLSTLHPLQVSFSFFF